MEATDGIDLVASWYYRRNTSAIQSAAFRIAEAEPDAVIIVGTSDPAAELIKKLRMKLDPAPVFTALSFVGSNELPEALDNETEGVYVTQVVPSPTSVDNPLVAKYQAALNAYNTENDTQHEAGFISLEGYIAGRLAIERLEACGADLSRECFLNVFSETTSVDIDGLALEFGPMDNQGSDAVFLTRINEDGEYVVVESIE